MIPEEMERLMQFILEHQAQFSVDMDKAKERMAEHEEHLARHAERMAGHEERMAKHAERMAEAEAKAAERRAESNARIARIEGIQENTARQIEHIGNALIALTESHERMQEENALTQEALRELAESQRHTDRRLDALIDIVRGERETGQEPQT